MTSTPWRMNSRLIVVIALSCPSQIGTAVSRRIGSADGAVLRFRFGAVFIVVVIVLPRLYPLSHSDGRGWGEGSFAPVSCAQPEKNPHPNPLPEYRERG